MNGNLAVMPKAFEEKSGASAAVVIPGKLYFRIGEVAELCQLPAYVLRYWESEFKQLKPTKGSTGQRMYRRRDVEMLLHIKHLLHEEGYTIAGARERLKAESSATAEPVSAGMLMPAETLMASVTTAPMLPFAPQESTERPALASDGSTLRGLRQQLAELRAILSE